MIRIAITGPECSGKSTLAAFLAAQIFDTRLIREFAREYLGKKGKEYKYTSDDILAIACKTAVNFDKAFQANLDALVVDTEFYVLDIWWREVVGRSDEEIAEYKRVFDFDLYLLCEPDLPWEFDPLRENPHDRYRLFQIYQNDLVEDGRTFEIVNGTGPDRMEKILDKILLRFPNLMKKD